MKKTIIAAALLTAAGVANAGLTFQELATGSPVLRTEEFNLSGFTTMGVGTEVKLGALAITKAHTVTYTYLGQESGFIDAFYNLYVSGSKLLETDTPGVTSITQKVFSAGQLDFKFEGNTGLYAYNVGNNWAPKTSIGLIGTDMTIKGSTYAYVIGYNDSAGSATLGDWDDFVIGVNVAPIPEPETYAMLLAGLGLMGFVARRRKQRTV